MIEIDAKQIKQFESDLKTFAAKAYPFATKATINRGAFETRKRGQQNIREKMILRNRFSEGSVQVVQARGLNVMAQEAVVGSVAEYLATQEFGGVVRGGGRHQPIATSYSAGQGEQTRPRTKLPRKPNRMQAIQLKRRGNSAAGRKARNAAAVQEAAGSGNKFVFLDLGKRQGIFRVLGGKRKPRVKMVWDLTRSSVNIRANPWLKPATEDVARQLPSFYADALRYQLKRHKVFGY